MTLNNTLLSLSNFAPEIFLFLMAMGVLMIGIFKSLKKYVVSLTIISVAIALLMNFFTYNDRTLYIFNDSILKSSVTEFFKYICYVIFLIQILVSQKYLKDKKLISGEFYSLLLFALIGCLIIISANNLIALFLGIELSSLSLYSLIALNRTSLISGEAAIKYFVLSIIASALILFGFSYLYGITNSLMINEIANYLSNNELSNLYLFSYILVFIGVAFKFAVAPFHMWLPDVYEGAPLPITNFIASIPKIAFFVFAYRFLNDNQILFEDNFSKFILYLGVFSIFIGNIYALAQQKIMRMLAYSGVANSGFIFLAIFVSVDFNFSVAAFYVITYTVTTVSAISIITFISSNKFDLIYIKDFKGLSSKSGLISILFMITLLSTAGIPLTVGFYAKYLVLDALVNQSMIVTAVIVVLFTVIGLYYYLRVIWFMFFETGFNSLVKVNGVPYLIVLSIIPFSIIAIFIFPDFVFSYLFSILT